MTAEPKKRRDPPLRLDMDFAEALGRFVQTDPAELTARRETEPPPAGIKRRPARARPKKGKAPNEG